MCNWCNVILTLLMQTLSSILYFKKVRCYFSYQNIIFNMFLFLKKTKCRGYKRFFRRALLENSDFLKDDCLKITCTVGVVVSAVDCSRLHPIQVPDSDIGSDFGMLLENMEGSDATFNVAGEIFHAHKLVLAARSPVFCSEFFEELDSDGQDITVSDMEPKVFKVSKFMISICL